MTAVHILSIAGYDSDYSPIMHDKRKITTRHPALLHAVNEIIVDSADRMDRRFGFLIPDQGKRNWANSAVMDEVGFSIYSALRDKRDARRREMAATAA